MPIFANIPARTALVRIYRHHYTTDTALTFSSFGPRHRFDHHRPTASGPADDPDRRTAYFGYTLSCCMAELFGDTGVVEYDRRSVAAVQTTRELHLLDLRGSGALRAGVNSVISKNPDRAATQEFSRHVYEQTAVYGLADGLIWFGAQNDETVVGLYERAEGALVVVDEMALDDTRLLTAVSEAATENNLILPGIP